MAHVALTDPSQCGKRIGLRVDVLDRYGLDLSPEGSGALEIGPGGIEVGLHVSDVVGPAEGAEPVGPPPSPGEVRAVGGGMTVWTGSLTVTPP